MNSKQTKVCLSTVTKHNFIGKNIVYFKKFNFSSDDNPLIVQFAANNMDDFVGAAELVAPLVLLIFFIIIINMFMVLLFM
jgi:hypothetical protein